jgi:hypothetical protein
VHEWWQFVQPWCVCACGRLWAWLLWDCSMLKGCQVLVSVTSVWLHWGKRVLGKIGFRAQTNPTCDHEQGV